MKLKIIHILVFFFISSTLFQSCQKKGSGGMETITVSIIPQKYFVEKIAGDLFEINVMIPPGASPATYDPTPGQMAALAGSVMYFKIGHIEFEKTWMDKITRDYPHLKVIDTSTGIEFIEDSTHAHTHSHHHDQGWIEPHIWMSPQNVIIIAKSIYEALSEYDSKNSEIYFNNYTDFVQKVEKLHVEIANKVDDLKSKSFIIYHPALTYFARDFGLNQIAVEVDGKDPSPQQMKKMIDKARAENIKLIFVQKQFDKTKAEVISQEIDGKIIQIDPLAYNWDQQLMEITNKLLEHLKQR
jgi:zinc transport system substrate-binding protein